MTRKTDESRRASARRLYAVGTSSAEIASALGTDPRTVQRWCADIIRPPGARPNPAVSDQAVIRMRDVDGLTFAEIASMTALGSWESARARYRRAKGLPRYPDQRQPEDDASR